VRNYALSGFVKGVATEIVQRLRQAKSAVAPRPMRELNLPFSEREIAVREVATSEGASW
jgi:hypothetical protein